MVGFIIFFLPSKEVTGIQPYNIHHWIRICFVFTDPVYNHDSLQLPGLPAKLSSAPRNHFSIFPQRNIRVLYVLQIFPAELHEKQERQTQFKWKQEVYIAIKV